MIDILATTKCLPRSPFEGRTVGESGRARALTLSSGGVGAADNWLRGRGARPSGEPEKVRLVAPS